MSSSQKLRWVLLILVILTGLTVAILWRMSAKEVKKTMTPDAIKIVGPVQKLEQGKSIEMELKGGEGHAYELPMKAGQYAYVIADQKGIDIAVRLIGPDGRLVRQVDSPNGRQGPEPVDELSEAGGAYRVEVVCEDPRAARGPYEIRLEILRPATADDRKRFSAGGVFAEGERLRHGTPPDSFRTALVKYREVLPVWRELGEKERLATTLHRIGWMSKELNDLVGALAALEEAAPLYHELGDKLQEATVLNLVSLSRFERGETGAAGDAAARALALAQEIGAPARYLEAEALTNLGHAHAAGGKFQEALDAYQGALAAAGEAQQSATKAVALFGIGDVQTDLGRLEPALDTLGQALAIFRSLGQPQEEANTLKRLAEVQQRMGNLPEARKDLEDVLRIARGLKDLQTQAATLNSLGTVYLLLEETEPAGAAYREAVSLSEQLQSPTSRAFSLLGLGRYDQLRKDPQQALAHHEEAAALFRAQGNLPGEVSTLFGSARALRDLGNYKAADEKLQWVLKHVELLRTQSASEEMRTSYLATKQHYYDLHIDVLMHRAEQETGGDFAARAFAMNEQRRARGLLDLLLETKAGLRKGADPELLAEERSLHEELNAANSALLHGGPGLHEGQGGTGDLQKRQSVLLSRLETVRGAMVQRSPHYAELAHPKLLSLEEIQSEVLGHDSLMLVYSLGEERSFVWVISKEGGMISRSLPRRKDIENVARDVYAMWRRPGGARSALSVALAERLSDILIRPVMGVLERKRLVIVSDGALQYIPFAALPDPRFPVQPGRPRPPLVHNHQIVNLPSASVLAVLRRDFGDRPAAPERIAVIADPVFSLDDSRFGTDQRANDGSRRSTLPVGDLTRAALDVGLEGLERLPFTQQEAEAIRSFIPEDQRFEALGFNASRETVTSGVLARYRILHFATHGLLDPRHPELSGLVFSLVDQHGQPLDGYLRSYEICDLDLNADLAVLSACQTGLGNDIRGEGLVGLTRSFMYAGVPRVLVSLWNVSDRSTAELMRRFYKGLINHRLTPPGALRCAQISMTESKGFSDPYQWAGFILQGDWTWDESPDGGIEAPPPTTKVPIKSDNSLPPPTPDRRPFVRICSEDREARWTTK